MASVVAFIITIAALLGAVKGIIEFVEWLKKRKEDDTED